MPNDYNGLLSGSYWSGIEVVGKPTIVIYSFPTTAPSYNAAIDDPNLTPAALASFQAFTASEQAMARTALAEWGNAIGLIFIEVAAGKGDINFQKLNFAGTGYASDGGFAYRPFGNWQFASYPYFTSDLDAAGDVFMNTAFPMNYGTLLHEIGHAIGLKHPTEAWTNFAAEPDIVHDVWTVDDPNLTIMSEVNGGTGHLTAIDIQAAQHIYGTNAQDGTQVASWSFNANTSTLTQNGFAGDDAIRGSSVKDVIKGNNGNDKLFGLADVDTLNGGGGNDLLDGGTGADKMLGGTGDDTYFVDVTGDKITELAEQGFDTVIATVTHKMTANVEQLQFWGNAKVTGTGNDLDNFIFANAAGNTIRGAGGDDYVVGGAGIDKIFGGAENDLIYGEGGNDQITGEAGGDSMFGGGGNDRFIFNALTEFGTGSNLDYIGDFVRGQDKISLRAIDTDAVASGDQAFSFVGTAAFTSDARFQVRYGQVGDDLRVQIDMNHDMIADYAFLVHGPATLAANDFLL